MFASSLTHTWIKASNLIQDLMELARSHQPTISLDLPPKDIVMSSNTTKTNLIKIISNELLNRMTVRNFAKKLLITCAESPEEVKQGVKVLHRDLDSDFDEADYKIPQQVNAAVQAGHSRISVLSDDTDVFVLLCSFIASMDW